MMTNERQSAPKKQAEPTVKEAAKEMQKHFAKTGAYRTADLTRVLGDPRHGVGCVLTDGYSSSMRKTG
jgi:hypothetical protein